MKTMWIAAVTAAGLLAGGCSEEMTAPTQSTLKLELSGLEDVGANAQYEGWAIVNGVAKSTGTFTVNSAGVPSKKEFSVASADLAAASMFVLTLEPKSDTDPMPSKH